MGFDSDKVPKLYQTDPSGVYSAWKANSIGRSSKTVREFLEKNYKEDMSKQETIKLAIKSLLEVVQTGAKNIEIAIMGSDSIIQVLSTKDFLYSDLSKRTCVSLEVFANVSYLYIDRYIAPGVVRDRDCCGRDRGREREREGEVKARVSPAVDVFFQEVNLATKRNMEPC